MCLLCWYPCARSPSAPHSSVVALAFLARRFPCQVWGVCRTKHPGFRVFAQRSHAAYIHACPACPHVRNPVVPRPFTAAATPPMPWATSRMLCGTSAPQSGWRPLTPTCGARWGIGLAARPGHWEDRLYLCAARLQRMRGRPLSAPGLCFSRELSAAGLRTEIKHRVNPGPG